MLYFILILVSLFVSCSHQPPSKVPTVDVGSDLSSTMPDRTPSTNRNDGTPLYSQAEEFDHFLKGQLSPEQVHSLVGRCKDKEENTFCYTVLHSREALEIADEKIRRPSPPLIRPVLPVNPQFSGSKVTNWKELRSGAVAHDLKGLLASDPNQLKELTRLALSEKRCPNNIAVALAATWEDFLPEGADIPTIAKLYLKGARCARKAPMDREHFETRAALLYYYLKDYSKAGDLLAKVKPTDAYNGRAAYWLYRSEKELGHPDKADLILHRLFRQHPFSFHALYAMKSAGIDPAEGILVSDAPLMRRSKTHSRANTLLTEVETLKKYGFDYSAAVLVDWILSFPHIESEVRIYASTMGDPRAKVLTASEYLLHRSLLNRTTMELAYPKAFYPIFQEQSGGAVSPWLAMAVARKESVFNPRAISVANAQGLLQLSAETAEHYRAAHMAEHLDLLDPSTNVEIAVRYLNDLIANQFKRVYLAVAAYNAGEQPVMNWQKRFPDAEPLLMMDLMPYRETRDYVDHVLSNYFWYRRIYESFDSIQDLGL